MSKNISLSLVNKSISSFFIRYHVVIFTVGALGGLALTIFLLGQSISLSENTELTSTNNSSSNFDTTVIEQLSQLRKSSETSQPVNLKPGRNNPFVE